MYYLKIVYEGLSAQDPTITPYKTKKGALNMKDIVDKYGIQVKSCEVLTKEELKDAKKN